ncbi:alpha/beta fold hydrolase [Paenarthrobacter sp. NPDC056912]|uniref:alpha/beta fold hydrolase n=1 Tax=Paenarthrobacter sp. NPDC056912 TaxID=3345965 RepID=UPI0036709B3D
MSQYTAPNLFIAGANGTTYAYRRFGQAGTTPIVFFQHFRGNLDNWDPALVDAIAAEREVILFDASGIALSTGTTPATFKDFGHDALTFIDALGLDEVDLFGFSIGGFVAQEVALQRPDLVRRIVLAGTGPEGGENMHGWADEPHAHAMKDVQDAEDIHYLFFNPSPESRKKGEEFVGRIFTRAEDRDADVSLAARDIQSAAIIEWGIPNPAKLDRLASIQAPTLVANGDNDIMVPTPNSYLLADAIPNSELTIYANANHGFLFQYPQEFAAEVLTFLQKN